jgi:FKBP-type peptidyl-prolyl cis-trans isomerase
MRLSPSVTKEAEKMRRFRFRSLPIAFAVATGTAGVLFFAAPSGAAAQTAGKTMTTASGLQIIDNTVGTGAAPKPGQICVMHYTGWLYEGGKKGKKFDSSVDRNEPFEFPIGQGRVIAGWDEGVSTMKVGGKRTLIIPPALGYGARGAGGAIPPNATLMFDVELLGVKG